MSSARGDVEQIVIRLVARAVFGKAAFALLRLRALPAGRAVVGAERGRGVEARGAVAAITAEAALGLGDLDIGFRQLVEKARGNVGLPQPVHAPISGKIDFRPLACAGQADMAKAALLFEAGAALIV